MYSAKLLTFVRLAWLFIAIIIVTAAVVKPPVIDTSMMSLLPSSQQKPIVKLAAEQVGEQFAQRLLIVLTFADTTKLESVMSDVTDAFQSLPQVDSVTATVDAESQSIQRALFDYRYILLSDSVKASIEHGDTAMVRDAALAQLINPINVGSVEIKQDPFGLFTNWQLSQTPHLNIVVDHGYMRMSTDEKNYLVVVNLRDDAFAIETQRAVVGQIERLGMALQQKHVAITASGLLIHADAGAKQAQWEISTIGLGSLVGIVLLMCSVFGRIKTIVILLLPILTGCLVATATAFLVFKQVHIVTFAFGAGLIGVAIDYALHYLCERQQRKAVLSRILPGLFLGLISSALAYSAQAITPFPGLRQMAVFSVVGLLTAWLTVILWFPVLTCNQPLSKLSAADKLLKLQATFPSVSSSSWLLPSLVVLTLLSLLAIFNGQADDDVRLLQTSPEALVEQETHIQQQLGLSSGTQFLLIPCKQLQSCLEKELLLKPNLEQMKINGELIDYQMVSERLPPLTQQQRNVELVEKLYQEQLATLFKQLNISESAVKQSVASLQADINNRLTWSSDTQAVTNVQNQVIETDAHGKATIIRLHTDKLLTSTTLADLQSAVPEVIFVDQITAISDLMKNYREQILFWVVSAYIFVFVILAARYKIAVWQIIVPPFLASIFTLAVLMQCFSGVNIFHMMALILVLGIGMDMGIFLLETKQSSYTWLAVTLSAFTSLLAFGLLALSNTPVLKHFGVTVLLGLTFVWILAVMLRQTKIGST